MHIIYTCMHPTARIYGSVREAREVLLLRLNKCVCVCVRAIYDSIFTRKRMNKMSIWRGVHAVTMHHVWSFIT